MVRYFWIVAAIALGLGTGLTAASAQNDPCFEATLETNGDRAIAVCTKFIESGRLSGRELSRHLNNRGLGYMKNDDLDRALADFDEALNITPNYAFAYDNRGDVWREKGQFDRAIADYNSAIRVDPTFTAAYYNRGFTYERMGNKESARADYEALLRMPVTRAIDKWAHDQARRRLGTMGK